MKPEPVIVVRKRRRGGHAHHGGAWKVAYADFVTAMMAFFLVLWIVGQSKEVKAGVAGYFRDPGVLDHARSNGVLPGGQAGAAPDLTPVKTQPSPSDTPADVVALEQSKARIEALLRQLPEFERLKGFIEITATPEGLRIELIDASEATFFDSASAVLKPATVRVLTIIAGELKTLGRPLVIEGHTDSRPFSGADQYTNWELSADRANAARRQMDRAGFPDALIRGIRGYADTQPTKADDAINPRNRRVSLIVAEPGAHGR